MTHQILRLENSIYGHIINDQQVTWGYFHNLIQPTLDTPFIFPKMPLDLVHSIMVMIVAMLHLPRTMP